MGPRTDVVGRADSLGEPLYGLGVPGGGALYACRLLWW